MPAKEPGPIREALFLDVPYIIDSMFRWGRVPRQPGRRGRLRARSEPLHPAVPVELAILLAVSRHHCFPDLRADASRPVRCARPRRRDRSLTSGLCRPRVRDRAYRLQPSFPRLEIAYPTPERRAAQPQGARRSQRHCLGSPAIPGDPEAGNTKPHLPTRAEIRGRIAQTWGALVELGRYAGQLTLHGWLRLGVALLVLLAVIAGALAPLLAAARVALKWQPELIGCFKVEHTLPIWVQVGLVLVIGAGGLIVWSRRGIERPLGQFAVLLALWGASIVFLWSVFVDDASREASTGPYAHVYPIVVFGLSSMALLAFLLSMALFGKTLWIRASTEPDKKPESKDWAETYRGRLASTRLIRNDRKDPPVEGLRVTAALVNGVGGHPLQALLLPALVAVSFPTDGLLSYTAGAFAVGAALLAYGSLSTRWQQLVVYIDRWFLVGTPLPVSVAAIVLAALRLLDVQYVSTLLDAAPFGTVFRTLTMLYVAAWFFEYWLNYWPGARLLDALGTPIDKHGDVIKTSRRSEV